jgi:RHS repeat-associated protein
VTQLFTGKERDWETGLDYFEARYFSAAQGRFTSADEPLVDQDHRDPQNWNLYSYVRSNPLIYRDDDGREMSCTQDDAGNIRCTVTKPSKPPKEPEPNPGSEEAGTVLTVLCAFGCTHSPFVTGPSWLQQHLGPAATPNLALAGGLGMMHSADGSLTEPTLPPKTIVQEGEVSIEHYARSGDHGPAHLHVKGGGPETRIGQNGKPLKGDPELTPTQRLVVQGHLQQIRSAVDKIMSYFNFNRPR